MPGEIPSAENNSCVSSENFHVAQLKTVVSRGENHHLTHKEPVSGVIKCQLTLAAKELACSCKISLRTAYRHLANGTTPSRQRRTGLDGKTYPSRISGNTSTPLARDLALTQQALNRVDKKACASGFEQKDFETLSNIVTNAREMLGRWKGVVA